MQDLYLSKASKILVSMYDGPEQIEKFVNDKTGQCARRFYNSKR